MKERRNYFIDKDFQIKFIIKFSLIIIVASVIFAGSLLFFTRHASMVTIINTQVTVKKSFDFILPLAAVAFIFVTVASSLTVILLTLLTSHKISGPLHRFVKEIDVVADGDFKGNFNIRGSDQLKPLAKSLEHMRTELAAKHIRLQKSFAALRSFLAARNFSLKSKDVEECVELIKQVQAQLNSFNT